MYNRIEVKNSATGRGVSGYTVKIYAWSSGTSGYSGAALYTLTDNGDGVYYADVTTTIKGTVVITSSGSTTITVPTYLIGALFWGDNIVTLEPGGTT